MIAERYETGRLLVELGLIGCIANGKWVVGCREAAVIVVGCLVGDKSSIATGSLSTLGQALLAI